MSLLTASAMSKNYLEQAMEVAVQATAFDRSGKVAAALYFYVECVELLNKALASGLNDAAVCGKISEYSQRISDLQKQNGEFWLRLSYLL